jgi:hypothetical protein
MSAARNPDQSDFDLERFINMFDEALTSRDPRVIDALRGLMMTVTLTRSETRDVMEDRRTGPLRRLLEDVNDLHRRIAHLENTQSRYGARPAQERYEYERAYQQEPDITMQKIPEHLLKMLNSDAKGLK